jgi:phospholipid transport system substrate-binding protein
MKNLLSLLLVAFSSLALAQEVAPDVLVKSITTEVIGIIKQDKDIQAGNPKKIADVVEKRILPHFSFARMTQIAVAVNWRRATPEQQKVLTEEFKTLLVRTYSNALSLYRDQVIDFKPLRMKPDDTEVTIKSDIKQKGAQPVTLDYDMEKTPSGWKVFDVKVSGVSLITNYREEFAAQVRESGIDGLIKVLVSKNRGARPEKT